MSNEPDEVNSGALATAIVLVALATAAIALVVEALVRTTVKEVLVDKDQTQETAFRHMKSEQLGALVAAPAWRDRASGLVSVPIDRAKEIVLADIRANPYAMSPGYKPPAEEEKCALGESCVTCAEDENCAEGACPEGQKCAIPAPPCPPGQPCPEAPALETPPSAPPAADTAAAPTEATSAPNAPAAPTPSAPPSAAATAPVPPATQIPSQQPDRAAP